MSKNIDKLPIPCNPAEHMLCGIAKRLDILIDLLEVKNEQTVRKKTTTTESKKNTTTRKRAPSKTTTSSKTISKNEK